jgi:hypothetical protein
METGGYLPLVSLARALAVPFAWNPHTYRGWIQTDSVETRFLLGSEVVRHGADAQQLMQPVQYGDDGVLIPLDYLSLLRETWNAGRSVEWQPDSDTLRWGGLTPQIESFRISQIGHQTTLRIKGPGAPRIQLLRSALGGLEIILDGWGRCPDSVVTVPNRGNLALRGIDPRPNGCRVRLDVAASVLGINHRYDEERETWELVATTSQEEIRRGTFQVCDAIDTPFSFRDGPVVLAFWFDSSMEQQGWGRALRSLCESVAEILSTRLGYEAIVLEGRNAEEMAGRANRYDARCLIGLRLDRCGSAFDKAQVWLASARHPWMELGKAIAETADAPRPPLWSETPELTDAASHRLAETISAHLESHLGEDLVIKGRRPTIWLEGLLMPSVLIYPANADHEVSLRRLTRSRQREELARSLAFGIAEALAEGMPGGGRR